MTFARILNRQIISLVSIAIVIGTCFGFSAPKGFAKTLFLDRSSRTVFDPAVTAVALEDSARDSSGKTDIQKAEQLAALHPSAANYLDLSVAYYNGKRYQDCISASRLALGLKPDYPDAYNNIAVGYQALNIWDSAIAASKEAVRLSPGYELAKNNLAFEISQKKLLYDNLDSAEKWVAINPTAENYVDLSLAYYTVGRNRDCVVAANEALVRRPDFALAWNNMSAAYIALSEWDLAIVAGYEAFRIDPTLERARNNMNFAISQKILQQKGLVQTR